MLFHVTATLTHCPFCLPDCLDCVRYTFNKVLETFLKDFGPHWHDSIVLQICRLHICDASFTTSQRCSTGLRSGDCYCRVPETGLRRYNVCDMIGSATNLITRKHYTTSLDPFFHCVYTKFWPRLNNAAEIEAHHTRKCFFQSSIVQF